MQRKHKFIKGVKSFSQPYNPTMFGKRREQEAEPEQSHDHDHQQNIEINITMNEKNDGVEKCLSGCFSACLGIGKKAATA